MLVPHRKQADLLMQVARRSGRHSVNRRCMPPLRLFNDLIRRGSLSVSRSGLPRSRTTVVQLTQKGRDESLQLARHYGLKTSSLQCPHLELQEES